MMNRLSFLMLIPLLTGMILSLPGQDLAEPAGIIPLYEGVAPGSGNWDWEENTLTTPSGLPVVQNVVKPVLLYYPAERSKASGTAMIIAPGGGFRNLMMSYEGVDIATYLNGIGVDAFVLKYRLIYQGEGEKQKDQDVRMLAADDGRQAVALVRERAREFGIKADQIGIMGFSAGGAVTLASVMGPASGRPDFAVPVYTPAGKRYNLPIVVPDNPPPLCIMTAADDQLIPWECSMELFTAWRDAGVQAELHIFQTGKHGFVAKGGGADHFMDRLREWMKLNAWIN